MPDLHAGIITGEKCVLQRENAAASFTHNEGSLYGAKKLAQ